MIKYYNEYVDELVQGTINFYMGLLYQLFLVNLLNLIELLALVLAQICIGRRKWIWIFGGRNLRIKQRVKYQNLLLPIGRVLYVL